MSWITVDTGLGKHPKMAALPSDAARWGWIRVLCEAKEQRKPGTFASANHFRFVLARHGRFLPDYIKTGLIDKDDDGTLQVHDWKRHQWAGSKAQQRETLEGQAEDKAETFDGQKKDASRAVPVLVPVDVVTEESPERNQPDAVDAFYRRTGEVPGTKIRGWLNELATAHTEARLVAMIDDTPNDGLNVPDYLRSVQDRLRLQDHALEREKRTNPRPPRKTEAEREAEYKATTQEMARLMGRPS